MWWTSSGFLRGKKKNLPLSKPKRSCHTYFDVFLHFKLFAKKKKKERVCQRVEEKGK